MSGSSSYRTFESEDESSGWQTSSEGSIDDEDELSDELTLLNGDEDSGEDSTTFEAFIKLSIRLKKQYNLREASVALERCDKIWDTMQLVKNAQTSYDDVDNCTDDENTGDEDENDDDEVERSKFEAVSMSSSSTSKAVPYIKYQPTQGNGNNALPNFYLSVKSQQKVYNCATCGKLYNEKRAFRSHLKRDHGIALPLSPHVRKRLSSSETRVTRSKTPQNIEANPIETDKVKFDKDSRKLVKEPLTGLSENLKSSDPERYPCPVCFKSYGWKTSMRKHAMEAHNLETSSRAIEDARLGKNIHYRCGRKMGKSLKYSYLTYICIPCGREYTSKTGLRNHALSSHGITLPKNRSINRNDEKSIKHDEPSTSREKSSRNDQIDEISTRMRQRAGPKSSKIIERPRRACAVNTSYTECTKEEEEALQREILSMSILKQQQKQQKEQQQQSEQPSTSSMIKCFLCKSSYVDIKRHFKDYHRITSPDSVLPLKEKILNTVVIQTDEKSVDKVAEDERKMDKKSLSDKKSVEGSGNTSNMDERFEGLYRRIIDETNGRQIVQCLMCLYKYGNYSAVKRHLKGRMVNGVVQEHTAYIHKGPRPRRKLSIKNNNNDEKIKDPLQIENSSDTTRRDDSTSDDNDNSSRKRGTSFSDESSSMSEEITSKRRKIVKTPINTESVEKICDTTSKNNERDSVIRLSKKNFCYSVDDENEREEEDNGDDEDDDEEEEEDKTINQRDTRDSSDRDSGIGISITIKKRNNSYEVVDKDNYCGDNKAKDYENTKDENVVSSDSSSEMTSSNFRNRDELASSRRREIFDTLNYSEVRKVATIAAAAEAATTTTTTTTVAMITKNENDDDDDVAIIEERDIAVTGKSETVRNTFDWKEDVCYSDEACSNMPGKVPSLKVLCRNVLRRDEVSLYMENDKNSHQCPVCCRFYPTERDVTVHMLEHKVSRAAFRCARLHGIPSSALRRYGRRKAFE